jgi:hypothetical protein
MSEGRAEKAINDYVAVAGTATQGTFGWFLTDEHRHTGDTSLYGALNGVPFPMPLAIIAGADEELLERERTIKAAAGQGPVHACIKRVKRKLVISDGADIYEPNQLEQMRDERQSATVFLYRLCELAQEVRELASESRARLAAARAKFADAVEKAAKDLSEVDDVGSRVTRKQDMQVDVCRMSCCTRLH